MAWLAAKKLGVPAVALTIGRTIYLHNIDEQDFLQDARWVRHELAHVGQFHKYGFWRFVCLYLVESIRKGYSMNKYEIEAREAEGGGSRLTEGWQIKMTDPAYNQTSSPKLKCSSIDV
jgi:hypothetical protein